VIPAHNEEDSVATIVRQAREASQAGDRVIVVDSASTDDTAQQALMAGAEVLRGPLGKGAAMATALADVTTEWVCFLDADLVSSEVNVPATLRTAALTGDSHHVLGDYEYSDPGTILSNTFTIYQPLVEAFFPEVGSLGANSLTGYRALRRSHLLDPLPSHFGIESYLNISSALTGGKTSVCHLGVIESRFRYKAGNMAQEIARTILDLAEAEGRLAIGERPAWESWVDEGRAAIAPITATSGRSASLARLFSVVRRPMPSRIFGQHSQPISSAAPSSP
jgi:glucosyl-3-phosphoglycerate synthase